MTCYNGFIFIYNTLENKSNAVNSNVFTPSPIKAVRLIDYFSTQVAPFIAFVETEWRFQSDLLLFTLT